MNSLNMNAHQAANSQVIHIPAAQALLQSVQPINMPGAQVQQLNMIPGLALTGSTVQQGGLMSSVNVNTAIQLQPAYTNTATGFLQSIPGLNNNAQVISAVQPTVPVQMLQPAVNTVGPQQLMILQTMQLNNNIAIPQQTQLRKLQPKPQQQQVQAGQAPQTPQQIQYYVNTYSNENMTETTKQQSCQVQCTCPYCTHSDRNNYGIVSHLRVPLKSQTDERPFACSWRSCNKKFAYYSELQQHNLIHTGEKRFQCPKCTKKFIRSDVFSRHMKIHAAMKRFQCPECTKEFTRSDHYTNHIMSHTGEKRFQCPKCTKKFIRSDVLSRHMKIHNAMKTFHCPECTKKFVRSDHLANHIKIHISEKMFQCTECTKKFVRPDHLSRHIKTHTKIRSTEAVTSTQENPSDSQSSREYYNYPQGV